MTGEVRFVVMSGKYYGKFVKMGGKPGDKIGVRSVTWQAGRMGRETATRFVSRRAAEDAAGQARDTMGPIHIEEITID